MNWGRERNRTKRHKQTSLCHLLRRNECSWPNLICAVRQDRINVNNGYLRLLLILNKRTRILKDLKAQFWYIYWDLNKLFCMTDIAYTNKCADLSSIFLIGNGLEGNRVIFCPCFIGYYKKAYINSFITRRFVGNCKGSKTNKQTNK